MPHKTSDEALRECTEALGDEYGKAFHHCQQTLWNIAWTWDTHETLFGHPERVAMLNGISGFFWGTIQLALFDQTLLGICRLTDKAEMGKRKNLSIQYLTKFQTSEDVEDFSELVEVAVKLSDFARDWRNRRIAHNDYEHVMEEGSELSAASRKAVNAAIVAILDVLRFIQKRSADSDIILLAQGNAPANNTLLHLYRGALGIEEDNKKLLQGELENANRQYPDWLFSTDADLERYR